MMSISTNSQYNIELAKMGGTHECVTNTNFSNPW
jgi:hypothetical protein